jgi:hypothetical protein
VRDLREFDAALQGLRRNEDDARRRLHVFEDADEPGDLLVAEADAIKRAQLEEDMQDESYDPAFAPPPMVSGTLFLFEGPFQTGTRSVEESDDPPDKWLYYNLHSYYETPAPNLMAPPAPFTDKLVIPWIHGRGYEYNSRYFQSIGELEATTMRGAAWHGVENPDVASELAAHTAAIAALIDQNRDVRARLAPRADVMIVYGDGDLRVATFDNTELPRTVASAQSESIHGHARVLSVDKETVEDFLEVVLGVRDPAYARVFLWEDAGHAKIVAPAQTDYEDFKVILALANPQPARLQIIEYPPTLTVIRERERRQGQREQKRRRTDTDALYELGATIASGESILEVHRLHSGEGLIVVDTATGDAICEHVHAVTPEALAGEQHETGKACPRC